MKVNDKVAHHTDYVVFSDHVHVCVCVGGGGGACKRPDFIDKATYICNKSVLLLGSIALKSRN